MKRLPAVLLLSLTTLLFFSCSAPEPKPKLVVFISVDQMRGDYLERFADDFTGGFRKLKEEGSIYTHADLNYAASETGPGHATLGTGSYPRTSGIHGNEWFDPATRRSVYCVEDTTAGPVEGVGGGSSPHHLVVTALGDWLKTASPASKVITASSKDRAAILMGGKHPDYAYWYDRRTGQMVTSDYYTTQLPEYVKRFNDSGWIEKNVPESWIKLMPEEVYARLGPDDVEGERKWDGSSTFPHAFGAANKAAQILSSPYGDMLVLDFAREIVSAENLGRRNVTDLLCIGLSCTDYVGHDFGPDSHEMLDHLLRLDRALGEFIRFLESHAGAGNLLIALSADHGVMPLPEYRSRIQNQFARRIHYHQKLVPQIERADRALRHELGIKEPIIRLNAFLNYAAAAGVGVDSLTLERKVRERLTEIDGIDDVYFRRELIDPAAPDRPYLGKFQRSYYAPRGEDFRIRGCEYCLLTSWPTGTSHGSAYSYDTHVPLLFWGVGVEPQAVHREVYVVDIAPTLAKLIGAPIPATVDGSPLTEVAPRAHPSRGGQ